MTRRALAFALAVAVLPPPVAAQEPAAPTRLEPIAPQQRSLEGNRLAQVPEHTVTLGARYQNPALFNASATARYVGGQFEDDTNTLPLGSYVVVDLALSRALAKWSEVFVGVENLFDTTYATGRTSEGVVSIGAPRLVHGGVRLSF